jgi:hypothetical protein
MLMINTPIDIGIMASRDAVNIHAPPRSRLNATIYSLLNNVTFGGFNRRMVYKNMLKQGDTQILQLVCFISS